MTGCIGLINHMSPRGQVIKMLFVVVILFAIFWLPLQTLSMILFLYPELRQDFEYQSTAYYMFVCTYFFSHWLSMSHSCLNPLVYCFMNDKFRSDLHDLLCNRAVAANNNNNNSVHHRCSQSVTSCEQHAAPKWLPSRIKVCSLRKAKFVRQLNGALLDQPQTNNTQRPSLQAHGAPSGGGGQSVQKNHRAEPADVATSPPDGATRLSIEATTYSIVAGPTKSDRTTTTTTASATRRPNFVRIVSLQANNNGRHELEQREQGAANCKSVYFVQRPPPPTNSEPNEVRQAAQSGPPIGGKDSDGNGNDNGNGVAATIDSAGIHPSNVSLDQQ